MPSPQPPVPVPERVGPVPDDTRRYAEGDTGVYETWRPRGSERGVTVALVHGGFWKAAYDRTHLRPLAAALADDGFAVASVEYPRVGMPGGGWPGTCDAVADALRAVVADPALPDRVVAVGHSAGGHLVTWCASSPDGGPRPRVAGLVGVVPLAGVVDLRLADDLALGDHAVRGLLGLPRDTSADGDSPVGAERSVGADQPSGAEPRSDEPPARPTDPANPWHGIPAAADPAQQRLRVPAALIHGTDDTNVPLSISQSYLAGRATDDARCRLTVVPDADHFVLVDPLDPAYGLLVDALGTFR